MSSKVSVLKQLERLREVYGGSVSQFKLAFLRRLERQNLRSAREVFRLHEVLCFLHAYPDNKEVLNQVSRMLNGFAKRKDLRTHHNALENSGIAGTVIRYPFYWFTAYWLAQRWPGQISIDWKDFDEQRGLIDILHLLLPYCETLALDGMDFSLREWISHLKGPDETDADFLIRRFKQLCGNSFTREWLYESFDIPIRITPGPDTPSRTRARYPGSPIVFQTPPLSKLRPTLRQEVSRGPITVSEVHPREGRNLINLAREAMVVRSRDLDAFEHAYDRDVRLVDCGQGLQFVCMGVVPERRLLLEAVYGFLTLKNGVPIGYVLVGSLFGTSEMAFNTFETYRGAESAAIYARAAATARHLFGSDTFVIPPYQLGHNNPEGLKSGAWWFYYKLGYRPHNPDVLRILRGELERIKRDPDHRTPIKTLNKLASGDMFLHLGRQRKDVLGMVSAEEVGLRISRTLADRFGADREGGVRACSREAARLLGLRSLSGLTSGERLAWQRWGPLIVAVKGIKHWPRADKRALLEVVRAKGGQRESTFVELFDRHRRLRKAILRLSQS